MARRPATRHEQRSLTLGATVTKAEAISLASPRRTFQVRRVDASRIENLGERQFAATRFDAQDTDAAVLNPGLHFQLNGAAPVRGYQAGDRGHPLNLELHRLLGAGFSGFVFHDRGGVRTEGVPDQTARSVGAGVDWSWRDSLRANAASRAARAEVLARHHACPGRSERIRNAAV